MEVTPLIPEGRQLVQSYRPGGFTVSGVRHDGSILVMPDRTLPWAATALAEVTTESLAGLREAQPAIELLLLGTGAGFALVDPKLRAEVRQWGIVIDGMTTPAAARTYNVLLAEGRRVAAALLAMPAA
ncbi:MAG: Mth938-like domain-containing protein [Geminicoccaceae bacterium]